MARDLLLAAPDVGIQRLGHGRVERRWENLAGFREAYPELEVTAEVYEIDRNRMTRSGGTAALDLMLSLIARDHGRALARAERRRWRRLTQRLQHSASAGRPLSAKRHRCYTSR
ncbi:MAG: hypothetical protein IIA68_10420, partial [Proteobacteria bacterium]|nr:hypothetical protein [Pseudomonadota bacterium]